MDKYCNVCNDPSVGFAIAPLHLSFFCYILVLQLSSLAMRVCVLYYGGILVTRGGVSSGDLVSFILYELQFSSAVEVRNKDGAQME